MEAIKLRSLTKIQAAHELLSQAVEQREALQAFGGPQFYWAMCGAYSALAWVLGSDDDGTASSFATELSDVAKILKK